jgi:splicing factor 3B subunit 2
MEVSDLKQAAQFPEVVDVHDICSVDPVLLVQLKSLRNSVPVPGHWSQKRKYLQGKRGQEKSSFKLPDYIEATGIAAIRQAHHEQESEKKAKTKQRLVPFFRQMLVLSEPFQRKNATENEPS